jgi:peptidoglycan-N-acetylglucosamine deacetylase
VRTRHFVIGLALAAVALIATTMIFSPSMTLVGSQAPTTQLPTTQLPTTQLPATQLPATQLATTGTTSGARPSAPGSGHQKAKSGPRQPVGPSAPTRTTPASKPSVKPPTKPSTTSSRTPASSGTPSSAVPKGSASAKPAAPVTPKAVRPVKPLKPGSKGVVYLTFDDGPGPYTPAVLRILQQSHSTATFFQMGNHRQEWPALAQRVRAQGNAIGNHTYDHADLTKLSAAKRTWELDNGPAARCVRPPYGATNAKVRAAIRARGAREVLWTVDTLDWTRPGAPKIFTRASGPAVHNGSIVLMHDDGGDRTETVAALPAIIQALHYRGYVVRKLPGC